LGRRFIQPAIGAKRRSACGGVGLGRCRLAGTTCQRAAQIAIMVVWSHGDGIARVVVLIETVAPQSEKLQPCCGLVLTKGADGRSFIVFNVEDGIELGDLQQVVHFLGQVQQLQFATLVAHGGKGAD